VGTEREPIAARVAAAAARTVAAGTARLFAAWPTGSPVPETADRRCDGVADLAARRARVAQAMFFTDEATAAVIGQDRAGQDEAAAPAEQAEMVYDGANCYVHVGDSWTGFFLGDPGGPRHHNDPLWPLDALFGAGDNAVEVGPEEVRGVPTVRCRVTVDLGRADAALPAGVSVPGGPYRSLSRLPAEVWLDAAGLARRIAVNTDSDTRSSSESVWSLVELWDFGVPVEISPPGADELLAPAGAFRGAYEEERAKPDG
jgi:hypothetical protein